MDPKDKGGATAEAGKPDLAAIRARIAARRAKRLALAGKKSGTGTGVAPAAKPAHVATPGDGNGRLVKALEAVARSTKAFNERMGTLESRMKFVERQAKMRHVSLPGSEDGGTFKGQKVKFMFTRAIKYILTGREEGCEYEAEVFREAEKKSASGLIGKTALEAGTDSIGGFLVPVQIVQDLIELIRANQVMAAAGITNMTGLSGAPVQIPKQTAGATGQWVDENVAPSESNQTFGQVSLAPHTAAALVKISKRLIMMATPAAEALVRQDLSEQLALTIDLGILRGTGSSGQPIGIANWPGILTVAAGANGGPLTYNLLVDIQQQVRNNNGLRNAKSPAWIIATALIGVLQKMVDANNRPLLLPWANAAQDWPEDKPASGGPVGRLFGYPVYDTTQIPTNLTKGGGTNLTEIYFGDMATVLLGQWGGVEIAASDQTSTAFEKRQVWVQIAQDVDVALRQEQRMCYVSDVQST